MSLDDETEGGWYVLGFEPFAERRRPAWTVIVGPFDSFQHALDWLAVQRPMPYYAELVKPLVSQEP